MAERKAYRLSGGLFDREDGTSEVKRLFFLSVEGDRTEPSYLDNLNRALKEFGVNDVVIYVLRHPKDGLVSPNDVYSLLEECINLREKGELIPVPVIEQLKQEFSDADIVELLSDDCELPPEKRQRFNEILLSLGLNTDYRKYIATRPSSSDRFAVVIDRDCRSHSRECLEKIAELEKIEASDEEAEAKLKEMADAYQLNVEQVKKWVNIEDVKKDVVGKKTVDFLVANAKAVVAEKPKKTTKKAAKKDEEKPADAE